MGILMLAVGEVGISRGYPMPIPSQSTG